MTRNTAAHQKHFHLVPPLWTLAAAHRQPPSEHLTLVSITQSLMSARLDLIWNVTLQFLLVIVFGMPMIKGLHAHCHIGRAGDYAWESTVSLHTCRSHCTTAETSHHWEKNTFPHCLPNVHCIWATHCMYRVLGRILPKYLTMKMRCGSNTFILILAKLFTSHPSSSPSTNIRQM